MGVISKAQDDYNSRKFVSFPIPYGQKGAEFDFTKLQKTRRSTDSENLAILTGKISGCTVVDVDAKDAYSGTQILELIMNTCGFQLNAPMERTPSGGYHIFFDYDDTFTNKVGCLNLSLDIGKPCHKYAIDIKNNKGYVVCAPSRRGDGKTYEWIKGHELDKYPVLPKMPDWLKQILSAFRVYFNPITGKINCMHAEPKIKCEEYSQIEYEPDNSTLSKIFSGLSKERCDDRNDWRAICYACKHYTESTGNESLSTLIEWSKSSNKFQSDEEIEKLYNDANGRITSNTLFYFLKNDNPKIFYEILDEINNKKFESFIVGVKDPHTPIGGSDLPIESLTPTVNTKFISGYNELLKKNNTLLIKSNMNTGKSYALRELLKERPELKCLVIGNRIALVDEIYENLKKLKIELYSDSESKRITPKHSLVCQLNSIFKVNMKPDIVVIDEIELVFNILFGFKKVEKLDCYRAIKTFLTRAKYVIITDALLSPKMIEFIRSIRQDNIIINNEYKSYADKIAVWNEDGPKMLNGINKVVELIQLKRKVIVPCNIKSVAKHLYAMIRDKCKSLLLTSDTDKVSVDEWINYQCVIYTPTITTGNSFNTEHFDDIVCMFKNSSCNPNESTQMIFRARAVRSKEINIYYTNSEKANPEKLFTKKDVEMWLKKRDDATNVHGLEYDNWEGEYVRDDYYELFENHMITNSFGTHYFKKIIRHNLELHGVKWTETNLKIEPELSTETKLMWKEYENELKDDVCRAKDISDEEYESLQISAKTKDEKDSVVKHKIQTAFGVKQFEGDLVKYVKNISRFNRLCWYDGRDDKDIEVSLENDAIGYHNERFRNTSINQLVLETDTAPIKRHTVFGLIKSLGFTGVNDKRRLEIDTEKAQDYIREHWEKFKTLWRNRTNISEWTKPLDPKSRQSLMKFVNNKLSETFGLTLHRPQRRNNQCELKLDGFKTFDKYKIKVVHTDSQPNEDAFQSFVFVK